MKIATLKKIAEKRAIKLVYSRTCDLYFAYDPAYTAGVKAGKMFDKATLENMSAEEFDTVVLSPLFPVVETVAPAEPIAAQPAVAPGEPLAVMALAGRINRECLDWLEIPGTDGELMLVAMPHGVVTMFTDMNGYATPEECYSAAPHLHRIVAPSWNAYVVDLTKRAAPECVAVLHAVMYEPNAEVMARAVEVVRNRRLTAEYLAVKDGDDDDNPSGVLNHYTCYACAYEWSDEWDCGCDDDCPECGARHCSPHTSEEVKA